MTTKEQRIQTKRDQIRKVRDQIGALMSKRAKLEGQLADLLPPFKMGNPVTINGFQPFPGDQMVVVEKRTPDGKLDFSEPQPPVESMTFNRLYTIYFWDTSGLGSWAALREWLESKHWVVRAKT